MKLRNDALHRGTSSLVSTQTHVENGAKIAKGEDALDGVMSQFSSLMSVMQDDFALMNDMEKEYNGEKSEVEPTLPQDLALVLPNEEDTAEASDHTDRSMPMLEEDSEIELRQEFDEVFVDTSISNVLSEHSTNLEWSHPSLNTDVLRDINDSDPIPQDLLAVLSPSPILNTDPVLTQESLNPVVPVKQVVVPTVQQVPAILTQEIVQSVQQMLVETVEEEVDAPRFELSDRADLPDFIREGVRLLDDIALDDTDVLPLIENRSSQESFEQVVGERVEQHIQNVQPVMSDLQSSMQSIVNGAATQVQASQVVQPIVTTTADGVSIQQSKSVEGLKNVKLPKLPLTRQHFHQLLEESQQKGTEQMGFNSKLIQRLEMVILDPMGRMDVEVAQEVTGINVKAVVPLEVLPSMTGLETDLQVALEQKGLDLNSFELYEREENTDNQGGTDSSQGGVGLEEMGEGEKTLSGGMLFNRRV